MKHKKTIFMIIVILCVLVTYKMTSSSKINYLSLGDSFAAGKNPYGETGYGYSDFVRDYLKEENMLKNYTKDFTYEDARVIDLLNKIISNDKIQFNNKKISIQTALEKADIITISIGSNDIYEKSGLNDMNYNLENIDKFDEYILDLEKDLDNLLKTIRKYNNKQLILVGYYNPLTPLSSKYTRELEPFFIKINNVYETISKKYKCNYVDIYEIFKENPDYLPNPIDIHPNIEGYEVISSQIINILNNNKIKRKN